MRILMVSVMIVLLVSTKIGLEYIVEYLNIVQWGAVDIACRVVFVACWIMIFKLARHMDLRIREAERLANQ